MEEIKLLIEEYKRRLKNLNETIASLPDEQDSTHYRLWAKGSCYRTIIAELERCVNNSTE